MRQDLVDGVRAEVGPYTFRLLGLIAHQVRLVEDVLEKHLGTEQVQEILKEITANETPTTEGQEEEGGPSR